MILRALTVADAHAFWDLRLLGFQTNPEAFGSSWEESHELPFEEIEAMVAERTRGPHHVILGAFDQGALWGILGFRRQISLKEQHKAHLWGVFVHPDWRGKGVGGLLLDEILRLAATMPGLRQVQLQVTAENAASVGLYRSRGFEVFGQEAEALFVNGRYYTDLHMVRRLEMRATPAHNPPAQVE